MLGVRLFRVYVHSRTIGINFLELQVRCGGKSFRDKAEVFWLGQIHGQHCLSFHASSLNLSQDINLPKSIMVNCKPIEIYYWGRGCWNDLGSQKLICGDFFFQLVIYQSNFLNFKLIFEIYEKMFISKSAVTGRKSPSFPLRIYSCGLF